MQIKMQELLSTTEKNLNKSRVPLLALSVETDADNKKPDSGVTSVGPVSDTPLFLFTSGDAID